MDIDTSRLRTDLPQVGEQPYRQIHAHSTGNPNSTAQNEAERAAKAGFDLIIAAGGDGTINEVVNGVAGLEHRPQMAFIPTGTTNDYARALKIPMGDPVAAAAARSDRTPAIAARPHSTHTT